MQWPRENGQTTVYQTLHRKLNSCAPEGLAVPVM